MVLRRVSKCLLGAKHSIQWFSHGSFVLRPHFLRYLAVYLLHVPRNGQIGLTRPRHTSSGPLFCLQTSVLSTNKGVSSVALLSWQAAIHSASSERSFVLCVTACNVEWQLSDYAFNAFDVNSGLDKCRGFFSNARVTFYASRNRSGSLAILAAIRAAPKLPCDRKATLLEYFISIEIESFAATK